MHSWGAHYWKHSLYERQKDSSRISLMRKQKTKGRSLLRNNRTTTTYVSAWTLHLTTILHLLHVTYKKVKQHYCPFKSCEGAKQLLHNFKKALSKGGTDGGCRAWLQSDSYGWGASIREHRASRLLPVAPGRLSCQLSLCLRTVQLRGKGSGVST